MHDSTERDIGVAITETGELIRHLGGKHRTAIAQALNLPTMPVEIRMVHTGWLAKQMERTGLRRIWRWWRASSAALNDRRAITAALSLANRRP